MRLNWHIGLPGPFSVSGPVVPRVKPPRKRPSACRRPCCTNRSAAANPRPQDRTIVDTGSGVAAGIFWSLVLMGLVVLAILGFAGFKL